MISRRTSTQAFTLIELLLASATAGALMLAMYALYDHAMRLRNTSEARAHAALVRARALSVLRDDLANAHIVGVEMGGGLLAGETGEVSTRFPGYLRFTTSTGRDSADFPYGDTQEVEYYIGEDPDATTPDAGVLMRSVDRVLLADNREPTFEQRLLTKVTAMEIEFYDGTSWTTSWETNETSTDLPKAVRVTITPYAENGTKPAPLEVLVPWSTQRP